MQRRATPARIKAPHPLPLALVVAIVAVLAAWTSGPSTDPAIASLTQGGNVAGGVIGGGHHGGSGGGHRGSLRSVVTGHRAELRKTVPIAERSGEKTRSAVSVRLPRLSRGDKVRLNGEVTISTTCVEQIRRCIGRSYDFDPRLRAQIVLSSGRDIVGSRTTAVSKPVTLTCQQTRPNRNHHCPLTIENTSFNVHALRKLPCQAKDCHLNLTLDASNHNATGEEFVVVGSDQPDGSVEGGKARVSATVSHGRIKVDERRTTRRINDSLPPSFDGGKRVVYSQKLDNLKRNDVLLIEAVQRTAIEDLPYFVSDQIVVTTRRNAYRPSALTRRIVSRSGLASETTGFNCTIGSSAFQSPCTSRKAGMATIESVPKNRRGQPKALYVNLVSRAFPKIAQARASYKPARIVKGGSMAVTRLRPR